MERILIFSLSKFFEKGQERRVAVVQFCEQFVISKGVEIEIVK